MIEQLTLGNVCANGARPLTTYGWGTDFIADPVTESESWDFVADDEAVEFPQASGYIDGKGGIFRIQAGDGFLSSIYAYTKNEFVTPEVGKRYFFKARVRLSDVTNCAFAIGLAAKGINPVDLVQDGIYFKKEDGDAYLDLAVKGSNANATTEATLTALHTLVNDTWVDIAFEVLPVAEGKCSVTVLVDGQRVLTERTFTLNAPATDMGITFGLQAEPAPYMTLDFDYTAAGGER